MREWKPQVGDVVSAYTNDIVARGSGCLLLVELLVLEELQGRMDAGRLQMGKHPDFQRRGKAGKDRTRVGGSDFDLSPCSRKNILYRFLAFRLSVVSDGPLSVNWFSSREME